MKNEIRNKELINDVLTFLPRNKTSASIMNVLRSINLQIRKDYSEIYNEIISKKRDFIRCSSSHINISQGYEKFMTKNLYDARQDPETGGVKGQLSFLLTNLWTVTVDSSIAFPRVGQEWRRYRYMAINVAIFLPGIYRKREKRKVPFA